FLDALDRAGDPALGHGPRRTQDRLARVHESVRPAPVGPVAEADLTKAVHGIVRGSDDADTGAYLETAVYAARDRGEDTGGAPGFENTADT
ncbi:hypothetical protein, partial [Microbacterium sp. GbtcB4]|uniref:hypothetical protein n=1 Tax=Microbacterium sp. GbtcB4 TaxID=2824749 RepID=UPI001C306D08